MKFSDFFHFKSAYPNSQLKKIIKKTIKLKPKLPIEDGGNFPVFHPPHNRLIKKINSQ